MMYIPCKAGEFSDRTLMGSISHNEFYIDGLDRLVQERCNSSKLAMELHLSCTNPSICWKATEDAIIVQNQFANNNDALKYMK